MEQNFKKYNEEQLQNLLTAVRSKYCNFCNICNLPFCNCRPVIFAKTKLFNFSWSIEQQDWRLTFWNVYLFVECFSVAGSKDWYCKLMPNWFSWF